MFSSSRALAPLACLGLALAACGGGDDDRDAGGFINPDATTTSNPDATADAGFPDTGEVTDVGFPDAGFPDAEVDAGFPDSGEPDGGEPDGGEPDGGMVDPVQQIAAVRGVVGVVSPALPVQGAWVTYLRPEIGDDPAGFFVQASMTGPALLVAVDPATLTPSPAVGDAVSFEVTETEEVANQHRVIAISNFTVDGSGNDVTTFVQDVSAATDVVSALDSYDSELISASGTLTGSYRFAGNLHQRIQLATAGLPTEPDLSFRVPEALIEPLGLLPGCSVSVGPTPMWRFAANAQISAWVAGDVSVTACANAPTLLSAEATDSTTVVLTFDRPIDAATAVPAQFTLQPAATVQSVSVTANVVTLTTDALTNFILYTVTVGTGLTDDLGAAIDTAANSVMFQAPGVAVTPSAGGDVVISEILQAPVSASGAEWFEVHNPGTTAMNLNGCTIRDDGSNSFVVSSNVFVLPGGYATFAANANPGFLPGYVWPSFALGNSDDEVVIVCGGTEIDRVNYDGGPIFPDPVGASMVIDNSVLTSSVANDDGHNWCVSQTSYNGDLGTPGAANDPCSAAPPNAIRPNSAGQVVVTEIMDDPMGVDDGKEWFELYNPSTADTLNLWGCEIADDSGLEAVIRTDLVIGPMSYATVGTSTDGVGSHGFTPDVMFRTFEVRLDNASDEVIINCNGLEIDRAAYDDTNYPNFEGYALAVDPTMVSAVANDTPANWCLGNALYDGTNYGTPGAANSTCMAPPDAGVLDTGVPDTGVADGGAADAGTPTGTGLVINEVDYDQPGGDTTEFVELYNAGSTSVDLTNLAVVTINGNDSMVYGTYALSGTLAAGEYLVVGNAAVVVPTGVTFITMPSNGLQNGAPDGVALIDTSSNTLLDAVSYEGSITAAIITGFAAPVSLVSGTAISESDTTDGSLSRLPNGVDTGDDDADFGFTTTPTPGAANVP